MGPRVRTAVGPGEPTGYGRDRHAVRHRQGQASTSRRRRRSPRWRRASNAAGVVLAAAVVAGAAFSGWAWMRYQQSDSRSDFRDTASSIDSAIGAAVQRDLDFSQSFGQLVVSQHATLSNRQLAPYLKGLDLRRRYPGTIGLSFYLRVPRAHLAAYEATMATDPEPGATSTYTVFPAGARAEYCLPRYGIVVGHFGLPDGLDICAPTFPGIGPSPLSSLVGRATDSGRTVVFGFDALKPEPGNTKRYAQLLKQFANQFLVITPTFTSPRVPDTVSGRRASLAGWVVQTFGSAALDSAIAKTQGYAVTVSSSAGIVVALGSGLQGRHLPAMTTRLSTTGLTVTVQTGVSRAAQEQGVIVGTAAVVLVGLIAAFLIYLRRSRRRALDLVNVRTGELRYQALHDALTGLPNRALLIDRAEHMLARSRRRPMTIGVLYVDLDNFKQVNDTFGHQVGDQLLVQVGQRLRTVVREGDTVGRLGGDEFLVLTEGEVDADLEMVAERLVTALRDPFDLPGAEPLSLMATASIGVAIGPRDNSMDLIRDADVALYQAKAAGRNRFCVFQKAMQTTVHDRLTLEMDLRGALAGRQLFLAYQPIVRLDDCTTTGVEALVRWRHPVRGVVPPLEFVPIAERSGLIVDIGRFVLSTACGQAATWHADGLDLQMTVNVSAVQLEEPGFVDDLHEIVTSTGLDPSKLTLELTESVLVEDTEHTADILRALKDIGVRIAIDDFGTGYSSLSYLRHFPIDLLKIDRTFVARQERDDHWAAFLHMLVELGRTLGVQTLAEGVEDSDQLALLQMEHCDLGQGYLFARPMPPGTVPSRCGLAERARTSCAA